MQPEDFYEYLQKLPRFGATLSLDRIKRLLSYLDNPEDKLKGIHVAGTNGKGSVSAMLFSMLRAAGYKVGLYTSPHLVSYAERFQINQVPDARCQMPGEEEGRSGYSNIPMERFGEYLKRLKPIVERMEKKREDIPTWFEILTSIAFRYFADERVDWAAVEVGMGGRFDATNVKDWGYKVITNVTLEHTKELGDTVEQIAGEKAGILQVPGVRYQLPRYRLVTACRGGGLEVVKKKAQEVGVGYWSLGGGIGYELQDMDWAGITLDYNRTKIDYFDTLKLENVHVPLIGKHQVENAACALGTIDQMRANNDIEITEEQIRAGLENTHWPGRMEIIRPGTWHLAPCTLILDGAHNPDGIRRLAETLKELLDTEENKPQVMVVFAAKPDKKVDQMLAMLGEIADRFVFTTIHELVPSHDPHALAKQVGNALVASDPEQALRLAAANASKDDIVLVCGSLYLIGEVKKILSGLRFERIDAMKYNSDARRI